jgi:hypothetical protein
MYAQRVDFKETKFVEALELYTYRHGSVTYDNSKTVVKYKDGKTIIKRDNNLTVYNSNNEFLTSIDLNTRADISLYFRLTKALFLKNFSSLEDNFNIKKLPNKKYQFMPKGDTKKVIESIELYLKEDDSIKYFIINFTNGDHIEIKTL